MPSSRLTQLVKTHRESETDGIARVVESIRDRIVEGMLAPGDRVPSERELAAHFGIGRSRVRQALQQLRIQGYLVSGRGRAGTSVAPLDDLAISWSLRGLFVEEAGHLADLMEFSLGVEVEAARLAATRRLPEDLVTLARILDSMANRTEGFDPDLDVAFHLAVVQAAHNVFYASIVSELGQILHNNMPLILSTLYEDSFNAAALLEQHSAIAAAIRDRDVHRAGDASHEHLNWVFREIHRIRSQYHGVE